jgi:hypothetical protein
MPVPVDDEADVDEADVGPATTSPAAPDFLIVATE